MESPYRILLNRELIEQAYHGSFPSPNTIDLELSYFCNQNCKWCFYNDYHKHSYLSIDQIKKIVDFAVCNRVKWLILSGGGEPTVHPFFSDIISYINRSGMNYLIITNGMLLNKYIPLLVDHCKYLRISMDAATNQTYGLLHGVQEDSFSTIIQNIRIVRKLSRKMVISLSFIVTEENIDELPKFIELAADLDVNEVLLKRNTKPDINGIDYVEIAISKYEKQIQNSRIPFIYRKAANPTARVVGRCYCAQMKMVVTADGQIPICCCKRDKKDIIGDINQQSISEIWGSNIHKRILSSINVAKCPECRFSECNQIIESFFKDECIFDFV